MTHQPSTKAVWPATPELAAYVAGVAWLYVLPKQFTDCNRLAQVASEEFPHLDSLEVVYECVRVAEEINWVVEARRRAPLPRRLVVLRGEKK